MVLAASLSPALAGGDDGGPTVSDIVVQGNQALSRDAVLYHIRSRVGQPYDQTVVQADEQRLLKTGRFRSVRAFVARQADGVVLTFEVAEHPTIEGVVLVGNKQMKTDRLTSEMPYATGDPFNAFTIEAGTNALITIYQQAGYQFVEVTSSTTGRQVTYTIIEGPKIALRAVRFEGNSHYRDWELRQRVSTSAGVIPRMVRAALNPEEIDRDVHLLRQIHIDEGFLGVEVSHRLEYNDNKKWVTVVFVIAEHDRYRINLIQFEGNVVFGDDQLIRRTDLVQGDFVRAPVVRRSTQQLQDTYGEVGYIEATVQVRYVYVDPAADPPAWAASLPEQRPALVNIIFEIVERDEYLIGQISIRGNTITQERVIRRELRFFPEQHFDSVAVRKSQQRLMETRLFDQVNITPVGEGRTRNVLVEVVEADTGNILFGVGVSTNSGLLGSVSVTEHNFDLFAWPGTGHSGQMFRGAGQRFRLSAEPGTDLMRFTIDWFEPYLFDKPYTLGVKGFLFTRERDTYDELRGGVVVSVGRRLPNRWYAELAMRVEGVNIDDLDSSAPPDVVNDQGSHFLIGLKNTLVRDRTDSRWMPTSGDRLQVSFEHVFGSSNFGRLDASYKVFYTVHVDALDRRHVLAARAAVGQIFGDAPVFERYYGGGLGSLRGFEYRGVTPRQGGERVGGDFMLLLGAEYIFPIFGDRLKGVTFIDTGTVESSTGVSDYRVAIGAGLRWIVPILGPVPVSIDFAVPLLTGDGDEKQVVAFFIGWSY
jgi:outer membrane protein insertion porin family